MIDIIEKIASAHHWRLSLQETDCPSIIEAAVDLRNWRLLFKVDPQARRKLLDQCIKAHQQKVMAWGLVQHEIGHWRICPFDSEGQYTIVNAIAKVVDESAMTWDKERTRKLIHFLSNIVSDIIVDTIQAHTAGKSHYADAKAIFFLKEIANNDTLSGWFELFIRLNMQLWSNRTRYKKTVLQKIPRSINECHLKEALKAFPAPFDKPTLVPWLMRRDNWATLAQKLATVFLENLELSVAIPDWISPSPFSEVLTVLYEGRSKAVPVDTRVDDSPVDTMPVSPISTKPVDPWAISPQYISWPSTQVLPLSGGKRHLQLHQAEHFVTTPAYTGKTSNGVPDLAFVIDSSLSMHYEPYAGKGPYDLLLRTIFSVFQWLKQKNIASYLHYAIVNFAKETHYSGWQPWHRREKLHRTMFGYQGANTHLDLNVLEQLTTEHRRPFVTIMVTDGELENNRETAEFVKHHFINPHSFILVQIGNPTDFANKIKAHGFAMHHLDDPVQLEHIILGEARTRYESP